jgi:hypothetical protein
MAEQIPAEGSCADGCDRVAHRSHTHGCNGVCDGYGIDCTDKAMPSRIATDSLSLALRKTN